MLLPSVPFFSFSGSCSLYLSLAIFLSFSLLITFFFPSLSLFLCPPLPFLPRTFSLGSYLSYQIPSSTLACLHFFRFVFLHSPILFFVVSSISYFIRLCSAIHSFLLIFTSSYFHPLLSYSLLTIVHSFVHDSTISKINIEDNTQSWFTCVVR